MCADDDEVGRAFPCPLDDGRCGGSLDDDAPRSNSLLSKTWYLASERGTRRLVLRLDHGCYRSRAQNVSARVKRLYNEKQNEFCLERLCELRCQLQGWHRCLGQIRGHEDSFDAHWAAFFSVLIYGNTIGARALSRTVSGCLAKRIKRSLQYFAAIAAATVFAFLRPDGQKLQGALRCERRRVPARGLIRDRHGRHLIGEASTKFVNDGQQSTVTRVGFPFPRGVSSALAASEP